MEPLGESDEGSRSDRCPSLPSLRESIDLSEILSDYDDLAPVLSTNLSMGRPVVPCSMTPAKLLDSSELALVGLVSKSRALSRSQSIDTPVSDEYEFSGRFDLGDLHPNVVERHFVRPLKEQSPFIHAMQAAAANAPAMFGDLPPMVAASDMEWSSDNEEEEDDDDDTINDMMRQFSKQRTTTMTGATEIEALKSIDIREKRKQQLIEANREMSSMVLSSMQQDEDKVRVGLRTIMSGDDEDLIEQEAEASLHVRFTQGTKAGRGSTRGSTRASIVDCILEDTGYDSDSNRKASRTSRGSLVSLDFSHVGDDGNALANTQTAADPLFDDEDEAEIERARSMFTSQRTETMMGSTVDLALENMERRALRKAQSLAPPGLDLVPENSCELDTSGSVEHAPIIGNGDFALRRLMREQKQVLEEAERSIGLI